MFKHKRHATRAAYTMLHSLIRAHRRALYDFVNVNESIFIMQQIAYWVSLAPSSSVLRNAYKSIAPYKRLCK
jgi:hypothetical protein